MFGRRRTRFGMRFSRTIYNVRANPPNVSKIDTAVSDATMDSGGVVSLITTTAGNGVNTARYLNWRCSVGIPASATGANAMIRVILFIDKFSITTVTVPTVAGAADGVLDDATVLASLNPENTGRFTILSDRVFTFNPGANAADAAGTGNVIGQTRFYKLFKRFNLRSMKLSDGDVQGPALYCLYLTNSDEFGFIDAVARVGLVAGVGVAPT